MKYVVRVASLVHGSTPIFKAARTKIGLMWVYFRVIIGISSVYGKHGILEYVKSSADASEHVVILFRSKSVPNPHPVPILTIGIYKDCV